MVPPGLVYCPPSCVSSMLIQPGLKESLRLVNILPRVHNPPECATPIQLCVGSWSCGIGSSDVMRTLHTSARPVSRQGTIVFDPRVPATPRVPLRCVRYYDAKIRFRSTKTLCRAGSGVAHSGGLCTLDIAVHIFAFCFVYHICLHAGILGARLACQARSLGPTSRSPLCWVFGFLKA